jgi:hypothetical protein
VPAAPTGAGTVDMLGRVSALIATGAGEMYVSYHIFYLLDTGARVSTTLGPTDGLILVPQPGAAVIFCGIHSGSVDLTVEARDGAPPSIDAAGWDEVTEVSLLAPGGRLTPAAMGADNPDPFPPLTAAGAGAYRLRVHARGRDTLIDGVSDEGPVENYRIVCWPQPPAPGQIHKQTDRYGADVRAAHAGQVAPTPPPPDPTRRAIEDRLRRARRES